MLLYKVWKVQKLTAFIPTVKENEPLTFPLHYFQVKNIIVIFRGHAAFKTSFIIINFLLLDSSDVIKKVFAI